MEKLEFKSLDEFIEYLNEFIDQKITSIIHSTNYEYNYEFIINHTKFSIQEGAKMGTTWKFGPCLDLSQYSDAGGWKSLCYIQHNTEDKTEPLFTKLHDIYIRFSLFNKPVIQQNINNISDFILTIDNIEKIDENIFLVYKDDVKYSYIFNYTLNSVNEKILGLDIFIKKDIGLAKKISSNYQSFEQVKSFLNACYIIKSMSNTKPVRFQLIND